MYLRCGVLCVLVCTSLTNAQQELNGGANSFSGWKLGFSGSALFPVDDMRNRAGDGFATQLELEYEWGSYPMALRLTAGYFGFGEKEVYYVSPPPPSWVYCPEALCGPRVVSYSIDYAKSPVMIGFRVYTDRQPPRFFLEASGGAYLGMGGEGILGMKAGWGMGVAPSYVTTFAACNYHMGVEAFSLQVGLELAFLLESL